MINELCLAAFGRFCMGNTGQGTLHSLAYNMIFISSVSTLLFNINPLMRFDGYYILSDLVDIPNLLHAGTRQVIYLAERYLFGCQKLESPAQTPEAFWLTTFGITGHIYRVFVFSAILLFMADRLLISGLSWVGLFGFLDCRANSKTDTVPGQQPQTGADARPGHRGLRQPGGAAAGGVRSDSFPNHFRAPGILEAAEHTICG